ncbi:hypothetical protein LJB42_000753 [Komagataella kurtzmanii]|nr:hypothetical protein LJB42_000753 [Komagataella kurtzmanii]
MRGIQEFVSVQSHKERDKEKIKLASTSHQHPSIPEMFRKLKRYSNKPRPLSIDFGAPSHDIWMGFKDDTNIMKGIIGSIDVDFWNSVEKFGAGALPEEESRCCLNKAEGFNRGSLESPLRRSEKIQVKKSPQTPTASSANSSPSTPTRNPTQHSKVEPPCTPQNIVNRKASLLWKIKEAGKYLNEDDSNGELIVPYIGDIKKILRHSFQEEPETQWPNNINTNCKSSFIEDDSIKTLKQLASLKEPISDFEAKESLLDSAVDQYYSSLGKHKNEVITKFMNKLNSSPMGKFIKDNEQAIFAEMGPNITLWQLWERGESKWRELPRSTKDNYLTSLPDTKRATYEYSPILRERKLTPNTQRHYLGEYYEGSWMQELEEIPLTKSGIPKGTVKKLASFFTEEANKLVETPESPKKIDTPRKEYKSAELKDDEVGSTDTATKQDPKSDETKSSIKLPDSPLRTPIQTMKEPSFKVLKESNFRKNSPKSNQSDRILQPKHTNTSSTSSSSSGDQILKLSKTTASFLKENDKPAFKISDNLSSPKWTSEFKLKKTYLSPAVELLEELAQDADEPMLPQQLFSLYRQIIPEIDAEWSDIPISEQQKYFQVTQKVFGLFPKNVCLSTGYDDSVDTIDDHFIAV